MGDLVPVSFARPCQTAAEFAERYRVLAAMSSEGVRFTLKPSELRAMAGLFDQIAEKPELLIAVVETEKPLSWVGRVFMGFAIAAQVMMIGEITAGIIWGVAG